VAVVLAEELFNVLSVHRLSCVFIINTLGRREC
jgi:hypothetical protein